MFLDDSKTELKEFLDIQAEPQKVSSQIIHNLDKKSTI